MTKLTIPLLLGSLFFVTVPPGRALAQEPPAPGADRIRLKEKYRSILERNPYHDLAFDKILLFAAEENFLEALVEEFETLTREAPADPGYRYLLARIYQKGDRLVEAVATLEAVPEKNDRVLGLLGELQMQRGEMELAAKALEDAASLAKEEKALRRLYRQIGSLHLRQGDKAKAAAAFRRIIDIDPDSYYLRKEVAQALGEAGLDDEALADYDALLEMAGEDASKRCAILRETGRIHEKRKEHDKALEVYKSAAELLGRGNWMKADLEGRVIQVHRARGTLDVLEASCMERLQAEPHIVDHHLFLARVLEEGGESEAAVKALRAATGRFPKDLGLGRKLLRTLEEVADSEGQVAEYQRLIAEHPSETDLYVELGRIFAREQKFAQAKLQWEKVIAGKIEDTNLFLRLADLYGQYDLHDDAIRAYELAIRIEPKEKSHRVALGQFLHTIGRKEEALQEWSEIRGLDPEADLNLAEVLFGHGYPDEALSLAEEIRRGGKKDASLYLLLTEIHRARNDFDSAKATAREAADLAPEATREEAITTVVSLHKAAGSLSSLVEEEEGNLASAKSLVPYLILGEVFTRTREVSRAVGVYRDLLEKDPTQTGILERLADLYLDGGDLKGALEAYERVLKLKPGKERPIYKKIAGIHLRRDDREEASQTWRRMIRSKPNSPAVYKDVADEYMRISSIDEAIHHYRQALERDPADPVEVRIALSEALSAKRDEEGAIQELREALGEAKDDDKQDDVRRKLYRLHQSRGSIEDETTRLRRVVEENPYDVESALLLADFYLRGYEYALAIEMLDRVIPFQRGNRSLLLQKGRLLAEMEEYPRAVEVFRAALKARGPGRDTTLEELGEALVELGDREGAVEVWASLGDKQREADLLRSNQMPEKALARTGVMLTRSPGDPEILIERARILQEMGKKEEAAGEYERLLEIAPRYRKALKELGELWMDLEEKEKAVACGRRLFGSKEMGRKKKDDETRSYYYWGYWYYSGSSGPKQSKLSIAQQYFQQLGLHSEFAEILEEEIHQSPTNLEARLALAGLYEREASKPEKALEVYRAILGEEWDEDEFKKAAQSMSRWGMYGYYGGSQEDPEAMIWQQMEGIYKQRADLRLARLEELQKNPELSPDETMELVSLYTQSGKLQEARQRLLDESGSDSEDARFLAELASRHMDEEEHEDAARLYRQLLEWVEKNAEPMPEKDEKRRRTQLLNWTPYFIKDNATKAQVDEAVDITLEVQKRLRPPNRWVPSAHTILSLIARAEFRLDNDEAAMKALETIVDRGEDYLNLAAVGNICFENDRHDEAEAFYLRAQKDARSREDNPVHKWYTSEFLNSLPPDSARNLGLVYKKRGEMLRAYDCLREGNFTEDTRRLLKEEKLGEALERRYVEETAATLGKIDPEGTDESPLKEHLEATIKLAEIHEEGKRIDDAAGIYRMAAEISPPHLAVTLLEATAILFEKERRLDEAIEIHREIIDLKTEMNRNLALYREKVGLSLQPDRSAVATGGLRQSLHQYGGGYWPGPRYGGNYDTGENYYALADLYTMKGEPKASIRALIKHTRENPGRNFSSWEIVEFAENQGLQAEILPLYRIMGLDKSKSSWERRAYAEALEKAGKDEEAIEQYENLISGVAGSLSDWDRAHAETRLSALYDRRGETGDALATLVAEVEAQPKNVKKRLKLARQYLSQKMSREASPHLEILREQAPYMPEVHELSRKVHIALGDRRGAIEDLRKQIELSKTPGENNNLHLILGNLLDLEGEKDHAAEAWSRMASARDPSSFETLAALMIEVGRDEQAKEAYRSGIEAGAKMQWSGDDLLKGAIKMALYKDEMDEAVDLIGQLQGMGSPYYNPYSTPRHGEDGEELFNRSLRPNRFIEPLRERAEEKPEDIVRWLLLSGACNADMRSADAIEALERALQAQPHSEDVLRKLIWEMKALGRMDEAIAYAERLAEVLPAESLDSRMGRFGGMVWSSGYGAPLAQELSGRREAYGILAGLHEKAGRHEKAKEYIRKLEKKTDPSSYAQMAKAYRDNEYHDDALAAMETFLEKVPEREWNHFTTLAEYLRKAGKTAEAIEALGKALLLAGDEWYQRQVRSILVSAYEEERDKDGLIAAMEKKAEEEPGDVTILSFLARAYQNRGRIGDAKTALAKAIDANQTRPEPQAALARLHMEEKEWAEAAEVLQGLMKKFPESKKKHSMELATCYFEMDEKEKAVQAWKAGQDDLQSSWSFVSLGQTFLTRRLYKESADAYREAVRISRPGDDRGEALGGMAQALLFLGEHGEALDIYVELFALKDAPGSLEKPEGTWRFLFSSETNRKALEELRGTPTADLTPEQTSKLGLYLVYTDDLEGADRVFRARLEIDPDDGRAWRGLYITSLRREHLEGALAACRGWLNTEEKGDGDVGSLLWTMGDLAFRLGNKGEAIQLWRRARRVADYPLYGSANQYYGGYSRSESALASRLLRFGLHDEAIVEIERHVALGDLDSGPALDLAAKVRWKAGDEGEAMSLAIRSTLQGWSPTRRLLRLMTYPERRPRILDAIRQRIQERPGDDNLLKIIARLHGKVDEPGKAADLYGKASEKDPDDDSLRMARAAWLIDARRYEEALPILEDLWEKKAGLVGPSYREYHQHRGFYSSLGVQGLHPDLPLGRIQDLLLAVHLVLGNEEKAAPLRKERLRDYRKNTYGFFWEMTGLLQKMEEYETSLRMLQEARKRMPGEVSDPQRRKHLEEEHRKKELVLLRKLDRLDDAAGSARDFAAIVEKEFREHPWTTWETYDLLCYLHRICTRDWEAALDAANRMIQAYPYDSRARAKKAWTYLEMGDPERAAATFEKAQQIRDARGYVPNTDQLFGRVLAYHRSGRAEEARAILAELEHIRGERVSKWYDSKYEKEIETVRSGP